jgi:hypothetical protein
MRARFVDKQEEAAVRRIIDKLAPKHPLRMAFDEGADTVQLIMAAKDLELRHLLRDLRVAALSRSLYEQATAKNHVGTAPAPPEK